MPLFRRRRDDEGDESHEAAGETTTEPAEETAGAYVDAPEVPPEPADPAYSRENGPWDVSEAPDTEIPRLDLGGLQVPGRPGLELRLEVDEESGSVVSVAAVLPDAAVQIQAFAAPRSSGVWREVRQELAEGILAGGGSAEEVDGAFGRELTSLVPVDTPDGRGLQEARFVGVDGPRWFLRGVFTGAAFPPGGRPELEDLFRGCVVVRGSAPLPPKEPIPLTLPDALEPTADERPPLEPFDRGPEITEVR
ncbi:MAG TPA: DUF3710 domain-containing protein [Actinomycetes bacterium]|nr:DUF3710 domain-containing protein [Actinomycetes bacterium]